MFLVHCEEFVKHKGVARHLPVCSGCCMVLLGRYDGFLGVLGGC